MKNKGYVILEVVITFTMVAIFAISVYSIINQFTDYERKSFSQYNSLMNGVSITYNLKKDLMKEKLVEIKSCDLSNQCYELVFEDKTKKLYLSNDKKNIYYGNIKRTAAKNDFYKDILIFNNYFENSIGSDSILYFDVGILNSTLEKNFNSKIIYFYNKDDVIFNIPILTLNEGISYDLSVGDSNLDPGYKAYNISNVNVSGTINSSSPGKSKISYSYVDNGRNISIDRNIFVWNPWSTNIPTNYNFIEERNEYRYTSNDGYLLFDGSLNNYATLYDKMIKENSYKIDFTIKIDELNGLYIPLFSTKDYADNKYYGFDFIYRINGSSSYFELKHYDPLVLNGYTVSRFYYNLDIVDKHKLSVSYGKGFARFFVDDNFIGVSNLSDFKYKKGDNDRFFSIGQSYVDNNILSYGNSKYKIYNLDIYFDYLGKNKIGAYRFDENEGSLINDYSGNLNNGKVFGAVFDKDDSVISSWQTAFVSSNKEYQVEIRKIYRWY